MTRFAYELRGSEGERCLVIYPYNPYRVGEIIEATPDGTAERFNEHTEDVP